MKLIPRLQKLIFVQKRVRFMYRDPEIFDEYHVGIIRLFLHYVEDFPYVYWEDLDVGSELFDFHMFYIAYMEYASPLRSLPYLILADEIPWVERGSETEFTNNMYQANLGDAFAQFKVGYAYYHGEDVGQNYEEAFKWLMRSLECKDTDVRYTNYAQYMIGRMYREGEGTGQNDGEAFKWFMKSAEQGNSTAQLKVGYAYYDGKGVNQNYEKAFKWLMQSGKRVAQHEVGKMLLLGLGVNKDVEEAFKWYMKLAQQGDEVAQYRVGEMLFEGQGVEKNMSEAFKWFMKLAQQEDEVVQYKVGEMLLLGLGINKDVEEAFKWFMKSAQGGEAVAQYRVGEMLFEGQGVEKNMKEAFAFFKVSAANGDDNAKIKLELLGNKLDEWINNTNELSTNDNKENKDALLEGKVGLPPSDIFQYLIDSLSSMPETSASQQSNKIIVLLHQEELHDLKINLEIKGEYLVAETFFPPNPSMMGRLLEISGNSNFSCKFGKEKNRYVIRRNCEIKKRTADDLHQNILEVISDVKLVNDVLLIEG